MPASTKMPKKPTKRLPRARRGDAGRAMNLKPGQLPITELPGLHMGITQREGHSVARGELKMRRLLGSILFALTLVLLGSSTPAGAQMFTEPFQNPDEMATPARPPQDSTERFELRSAPTVFIPTPAVQKTAAIPEGCCFAPLHDDRVPAYSALEPVWPDTPSAGTPEIPVPTRDLSPDRPWMHPSGIHVEPYR